MILKCSMIWTPWGNMAAAVSQHGLCALDFAESQEDALVLLEHRFRNAEFRWEETPLHESLQALFDSAVPGLPLDFSLVSLDLHGTPFQLRVWEALRRIPYGTVTTYGAIAAEIGQKGASQAVGNAVGRNPVPVVIPCHRVIRSDGSIGGYSIGDRHWNSDIKRRLLDWEGSLGSA